MFGHSGRRPIVAAMFSTSAINWLAVNATTRGAPVVAEVVLRWTMLGGGTGTDGGDWPVSNGHTTRPLRHARNTVKMKSAEMPWGCTTGELSGKPFSVACAN